MRQRQAVQSILIVACVALTCLQWYKFNDIGDFIPSGKIFPCKIDKELDRTCYDGTPKWSSYSRAIVSYSLENITDRVGILTFEFRGTCFEVTHPIHVGDNVWCKKEDERRISVHRLDEKPIDYERVSYNDAMLMINLFSLLCALIVVLSVLVLIFGDRKQLESEFQG